MHINMHIISIYIYCTMSARTYFENTPWTQTQINPCPSLQDLWGLPPSYSAHFSTKALLAPGKMGCTFSMTWPPQLLLLKLAKTGIEWFTTHFRAQRFINPGLTSWIRRCVSVCGGVWVCVKMENMRLWIINKWDTWGYYPSVSGFSENEGWAPQYWKWRDHLR